MYSVWFKIEVYPFTIRVKGLFIQATHLELCAVERPKVRLIPGSIEQRGTDIKKALQGEVPFCRWGDKTKMLLLSPEFSHGESFP